MSGPLVDLYLNIYQVLLALRNKPLLRCRVCARLHARQMTLSVGQRADIRRVVDHQLRVEDAARADDAGPREHVGSRVAAREYIRGRIVGVPLVEEYAVKYHVIMEDIL
jgi:hypothetical protein